MNNQTYYQRCHLALVMVLLLVCSLRSEGQVYKYKSFSMEHGLNDPFVNALEQDDLGYLWVGTGDGLHRFDGLKFIDFDQKDGLASNFINSSLNSGTSLWFGHNNGALTKYEKDVFSPFTLNTVESSIVYLFNDGASNVIGVSQSHGLFVVPEAAAPFNVELPIKSNVLAAFYHDSFLLLGTESELTILEKKSENEYTLVTKIKTNTPVTHITKGLNREKEAFFVTFQGAPICTLELKPSAESELFPVELPFLSGDEIVSHLSMDARNNLWISTLSEGLIRLVYDRDKGVYSNIVRYNVESGLPLDYTKMTFHDNYGNTWIGLYGGGLSCINDDFVTYYYDNEPEDHNDVKDMLLIGNERWLAVEHWVIRVNNLTGESKKYDFGNDHLVSCLHRGKDAEIIVGVHGSGVWKLNRKTGEISQFFEAQNRLSKKVNDLEMTNDHVLIATNGGLLELDTSGKLVSSFNTTNGLRHNVINALFQDGQKRIWVGTRSNVITYLEEGQLKEIPIPGEFGMLTISDFDQAQDKTLWISTLGNGVYHLRGDSIQKKDKEDGLLSDYCYSIEVSTQHSIWVGHKGGLSRLFDNAQFIEVFDRKRGYQFEVNSRADVSSGSGQLWFGTNQGLVHFDPAKRLPPSFAPNVHFFGLDINDQEYELTSDVALPYDKYKFTFKFIGLNVAHPERISYEYSLEGYEDEWHNIGNSTKAVYKQIPNGTYRLLVRAYNGSMFKESVSPVTITIRSPFWKMWWFYTVILIGAIGIVVFIIRYRDSKYQANEKYLNEQIREATDEIRRKNEDLRSSIEYARRIQNALLPRLNSLRNKIPEVFLLSKPKAIVSGDFFWYDWVDQKLVIVLADCTGHGVPGGFMTMLGINQLSSIVSEKGLTQPERILTKMHEAVIRSMHKEGKEYLSDGIDAAICTIDFEQQRVCFGGAMRPLVLVQNGIPELHKGTRKSIGDNERMVAFEQTEFTFNSGDSIYLFSDGIVDQFGGKDEGKFGKKRLLSVLGAITSLPASEQKDTIDLELEQWMGGSPYQVDDMLVLGLRLP